MGGIGDELPAHLLRLAEPVRQVVELLGQDRQLVVTAEQDLVGVVTLPDDPDGGHDLPQAAGKDVGIDDAERGDDADEDHRDGQNVHLQIVDELSLVRVVFQNVGTAGELAVAEDGCRSPGGHDTVPIVDGDDIVAPEGLDHFGEEAVLDVVPGGVIEGPARIVGDHQPGGLQIAQSPHGGTGRVCVQDLLLTQGRGDMEELVHHGRVLAAVEELLAGPGAVEVQKQHDDHGQRDVDHRIAQLVAAVAQFARFIS